MRAHESLVLGIDLSTTGAKAIVVDHAGRVVASASTPLSLQTPHPLWSEQEPEEWWQATVASIQQVLGALGAGADQRIASIGLTGQMHGLVLLDDMGAVLRPAILWNDQRTAAECDEIRAAIGGQRLLAITGNDALPGFTAPKILWVRRHEPAVYARVRHILLPKDYLRYRLSGTYAVDKAGGSGTLLFDLRARDWSREVLDALGIPPEWLPPSFEGPDVTAQVSEAAAARTGLRAGTPIVAGGGDQAAQAVGVGATRPGTVALTLGTSGVVFTTTESPVYEPAGRLHAFAHAVPGRWHLMGVMLAAAGSLQWYHDALMPEMSIEALLVEAETAPIGSDGLLFLPYVSGERTPYPDPLARGAWVGLTTRHRRAHLTRATLEGVSFGLRDGFVLLREAGLGEIREVRVSGGGARAALWLRILADVLGTALVRMPTMEGAAYGAALLAGVGAGIWPDIDSATAHLATGDIIQPAPEHTARYDAYYAQYRALYPALRPTFNALAALEE